MRRIPFAFLSFLFLLPFLSLGQKKIQTEEEKTLMAAKQVLMRVIGMKSESFKFELIPSENGLDAFEVKALNGKVLVKGSSAIAMTRGAYEYLRTACKVQYTWSTDKISLPAALPDLTIPRTVSPYKYRQYYSTSTFGYTNPYWTWESWQREVDWMALHGINMPVAMAGQEAIWQKVYKSMGMTSQELKSYFNGPAFLPWQRMGNLNSHDGPLPQKYIGESGDLQKQLLQRMMQLGMEPIVPGFSGFVPAAYKRLYPECQLITMKGWNNFPDTNQTYLLVPGSSDYSAIGKKFIEEYQNTYGKVHFFLAGLLNENTIPVNALNKNSLLAEYGKSIFEGINSGDPQGKWILQGFQFYNKKDYWVKESVKALLSLVPDDRMMIIDMANEEFQGWERLDAFFGKPWIYNTVPNYGGNTQLNGNLPFYSGNAPAMLTNTRKGNIAGFGISPEGIYANEVVFELLSDVAWTSKPIEIKTWLRNYTAQRYGSEDERLFHSMLSLYETVYSDPVQRPKNSYQNRPSMNPLSNLNNQVSFDRAVAGFLNNAGSLISNTRFKNDLVQLVVQYTGNKVDILIERALQLHRQGNRSESQEVFEKVRELMLMMDGLTYTLPQQRLETWIESARKWGITQPESDYYEADAKRLLTIWGNSATPALFDYSSRVWSGMIRNYYLSRWMYFAEALKNGSSVDFDQWEESWIRTPGLKSKAPATGDILTYARTLYNTAGKYSIENQEFVSIKANFKNKKTEITLTPLSTDPSSVFLPISTAPAVKSNPQMKRKENMVTTKPVSLDESRFNIYYTLDGSTPSPNSSSYYQPFEVSTPAEIKSIAYYNGKVFGAISSLFLPVSYGKPVILNPSPTTGYIANAGESVTDALYGSSNFKSGNWLGFEGNNIFATINLEASTKVKKVTFSYLEDASNLIYGPTAIIIHASNDGSKFNQVYTYDFPDNFSNLPVTKSFTANFPEINANYIKISLYNRGSCPSSSTSAGKKAWLFIDEISVE